MATKKAEMKIPEEVLVLYDKAVAGNPDIKRKGATLPYTSVNGNMFTFLHNDGTLAIRLPETEREVFIKKYKTSLMVAHGAVMKEYVAVPEKLLKDTKALKPYIDMSFEYAKTLKSKGTKKAIPTSRQAAPKKKKA